MIDRFLRAKHWQMFTLTFGIPMLLQFIMMGFAISSLAAGKAPNPEIMFGYMKFFPIYMIIFSGAFFGWFYSVAIGLQKKVPKDVKMKVKKFRIIFFIPMVYILFITSFIGIGVTDLIETNTAPNPMMIFSVMGIILPLHLLSMVCIFYSLYFVAKTFKTVELQREVSFSDFAGEFFLIWFYPIGIWIIQPKINKMMEQSI